MGLPPKRDSHRALVRWAGIVRALEYAGCRKPGGSRSHAVTVNDAGAAGSRRVDRIPQRSPRASAARQGMKRGAGRSHRGAVGSEGAHLGRGLAAPVVLLYHSNMSYTIKGGTIDGDIRLVCSCGATVLPERLADGEPSNIYEIDLHAAIIAGATHDQTNHGELERVVPKRWVEDFEPPAHVATPLRRSTAMNAHRHSWRGNHHGEGYRCVDCPARMTEAGMITTPMTDDTSVLLAPDPLRGDPEGALGNRGA